ncbi:MAG: type I glutamate--ammonia ligase [Myxococcota bacterium]
MIKFQSMDQVTNFVEQEKIAWLDIKFCDFTGRLRHVTLPASAHSLNVLRNNGLGFDASSLNLQTLENADMVLKPCLDTAFIDPFFSDKTLSFLASAVDAVTGTYSELDPRNRAKKARDYALKEEICTEALFAPEYEFYLFKKLEYNQGVLADGYRIEPLGHNEVSAELNFGIHEGYHSAPPEDKSLQFRLETAKILGELGVEIHYHHHEVGGFGQGEFEVGLTPMVRAADEAVLIKYVARQVAAKMGFSITFMPKPLAGHPGNGMHCHQTLMNNNKNLFYDKDGYCGLSQMATDYICGILYNGPALLALTNPSTNSYRRLIPGFEAPTRLFFSGGNRSAAIRIPMYAKNTGEQRIEFRSPDATANPYFLIAGQLMAGIDGIKNKYDPQKNNFGPVEDNIFNWPPERQQTLKALPETLDRALSTLKANSSFLEKGSTFTNQFINKWIKVKKTELNEFRGVPHPLELKKYYGV